MAKPRNWFWNPTAQRWENAGRSGNVTTYINDSGIGVNGVATVSKTLNVASLSTLQAVKVGDGQQVDYIRKATGTIAEISAIGTGAIAIGTITGIASLGVAVGDVVFGNLKADRSGGHVGLAGIYVADVNLIKVFLQNSMPNSAGSFPHTGIDIAVIDGV